MANQYSTSTGANVTAADYDAACAIAAQYGLGKVSRKHVTVPDYQDAAVSVYMINLNRRRNAYASKKRDRHA